MKRHLLAASILFAATSIDTTYALPNVDGRHPFGGVAMAGKIVYGTAVEGGANDHGTIWSFDTNTDTFTTLHDFSRDADDGTTPEAAVAISGTKVFGTASRGGANDDGTLWSFDTSTDAFTKLHDFTGLADGRSPVGGVAVSATKVFGTASNGGANGDGTLWSFETSTDTFTNLHDFDRAADGSQPVGNVAVSNATVLGSARKGGANGDGTLWLFDTSTDTFTNLHDFDRAADGSQPVGNVAVSNATVLGSAWHGGANGGGTLWSFDTNSDTFTTLHDFSGDADGTFLIGGVAVMGTTVFGPAGIGGANGHGTLWSFDTSTDTFANLHDFDQGADGEFPVGGVVVPGSTVFGAASLGGTNGTGTLWSFDTNTDTFTKLYDFSAPVPEPSLVTLLPMSVLTLLGFRTRRS